jgi:hypothetical protein
MLVAMPYADPEKQREAQARWYQEKYEKNRAFRRREAKRKAQWLRTADGKASNAAASTRARNKIKVRKVRAKRKAGRK